MSINLFRVISGSLFLVSISLLAQDTVTFRDGLNAYQNGRNLQAYYIWNSLAAQGDPVSAYNLGVLFAQGLGVEKDPGKAADLYQQSAEAGYAPAQFNLGMVYLTGEGVNRDFRQAAQWWVAAAEQGSVQAMFNLATLFNNGLGVKKDESIARRLYRMAADRGDPRAMKMLSGGYQNKQGTSTTDSTASAGKKTIRGNAWIERQPKDNYTVQVFTFGSKSRAVKTIVDNDLVDDVAMFRVATGGKVWFKVVYRSFATRHAALEAKRRLSTVFPVQKPWVREFSEVSKELRNSNRTRESMEVESVRTSDHAANTNDLARRAQSAFNRQHYSEALALWEPLAKKGFTDAQYALGFLYESGWGVDRDYARAFNWYGKAAEAGHAKSQYNLGMLYLSGLGVDRDPDKGRYWIQAAAVNNDTRAIDYLDDAGTRER